MILCSIKQCGIIFFKSFLKLHYRQAKLEHYLTIATTSSKQFHKKISLLQSQEIASLFYINYKLRSHAVRLAYILSVCIYDVLGSRKLFARFYQIYCLQHDKRSV